MQLAIFLPIPFGSPLAFLKEVTVQITHTEIVARCSGLYVLMPDSKFFCTV